jgi:hypothetical protein
MIRATHASNKEAKEIQRGSEEDRRIRLFRKREATNSDQIEERREEKTTAIISSRGGMMRRKKR